MTTDTALTPERYLSAEQFATLAALVEGIIPSDEAAGGAREAGVADFIDVALAGHDAAWQTAYQEGLGGVDAYSRAMYGSAYADLDEDRRGIVLNGLADGTLAAEPWATGFFGVLWQHTVQGYLCDPSYGGNRDMVGWKAVGFPGAQYGYGPEVVYGTRTPLPLPVPREAMRALAEAEPQKFFSSYPYEARSA